MFLLLLLLSSHVTVAQPPHIDALSPSEGPITGGFSVVVSGSGFAGAVVKLDDVIVSPSSQTDTEVRLTLPPHANGYSVIAIEAAGEMPAYTRFLYVPPRLEDLPPGFITTVAGIGQYGGEYGQATDASLRQAWGVALDPSGSLYLTDTPNNRVLRVRTDGVLEPFAGNGTNLQTFPQGPVPARSVAMSFPRSIATDSHGNVYVPSHAFPGGAIWRVTPAGVAELIAGKGQPPGVIVDGSDAREAAIGEPTYLAIDGQDNIFFIDFDHAKVFRIDPAGKIRAFAGNGAFGFSGDGGPATNAQFKLAFNDLGGLAVDRDGNVFLLDADNHRVRRIDRATGIIDTIAGPTIDGHLMDAPRSIAVDTTNAVWFSNAAEVYRRASDGTITQIHSGNLTGFTEDGALFSDARIGLVQGMIVDAIGNLIYADSGRVRRVDHATHRISTLVGIAPRQYGEGGRALAAILSTGNLDLDFLPSGELLIADVDRLLEVDADSHLVRIAGSGVFGPLEGVPALAASIMPASASVDSDGTIDYAGGNIFRVDPDGIIRRTATMGYLCGFSGDHGDALLATGCQPWDALRDRDGNLLFTDTNNNRIRRVSRANGIITTIAGSGPTNGLEHYGAGSTCGDGGLATNACINTPYGLAFDDEANLYVCENRDRIRKIDRGGTITTYATLPCTKLWWSGGSLYTLAHDYLARIPRRDVIVPMTKAGFPLGFSGDGGPAVDAHLFGGLQSHGVAVDAEGNLFVADGENLRIRAIRYGALLAPPAATIQASKEGSTIHATVHDAEGHPARNVRVDFDVPASAASCILSAPFAITDADGTATIACTPNCVAGTYSVTARPLTSTASATLSLTNRGCNRRRAVRH